MEVLEVVGVAYSASAIMSWQWLHPPALSVVTEYDYEHEKECQQIVERDNNFLIIGIRSIEDCSGTKSM
jgi:hypothetical protein